MKKTNPEILRYTKNSGSFWLCMLAIATDVLYFTGAFSPIMAGLPFEVGFVIAIDVIINILFMLFILSYFLNFKLECYSDTTRDCAHWLVVCVSVACTDALTWVKTLTL